MSERIKLTDNSNVESPNKIADGVFVNTGIITDFSDKSNYPMAVGEKKTIGEKGFEPELCLEIYYKNENADAGEEARKITLFGKYKRNSKGQITGWDPWNNHVQRILYKLLGEQAEINVDFSIPEDVLMKLVGKKFQYVRYQTNRPYLNNEGQEQFSMQTWQKLFSVTDLVEEIETEWTDNFPWIKDYAPLPKGNYTSAPTSQLPKTRQEVNKDEPII